ncbi:hypothetical protein T439DRAFT_328036 [Meredithblackwellia eburnea MCA 4105]
MTSSPSPVPVPATTPPALEPSSPTPSPPSGSSEPSTPVNHIHHAPPTASSGLHTSSSSTSLHSSGSHHHGGSSVIPAYPYNVSMAPLKSINGQSQTPDDLGITTRLPSICVDYLSHDWAEDDVWTSWKAMTRHKAEIANGVRLENASWRTWAKQRGKLKTISPETLNWLKDSDVTWLYGPLHTAVDAVPPPREATASERLGLEPLRSLSDSKKVSKNATDSPSKPPSATLATSPSSSTAILPTLPTSTAATAPKRSSSTRKPPIVTKPILKYRSLSDILLPANQPSSPVLEMVDEVDPTASGVHYARSETNLWRMGSGSRRRRSPTATPPNELVDGASQPPVQQKEKRHISFNHRVEQCIAVDASEEPQNNNNLNQAKRYYPHRSPPRRGGASSSDSGSGSGSDSGSDDDEDDVLTFGSSPRVANFGPNVMSGAPGGSQHHHHHHHGKHGSGGSGKGDWEPHTIARLGPTTLKSTEMWPAPSPAVVYQTFPDQQQQQQQGPVSRVGGGYGAKAVPTYAAKTSSSAPGGRRTAYDYSNPHHSSQGTSSQWDPDDDEDYAMGFDYFNGPDVMVGDEYDMAQYGSQHLVGTSHNNYQGGAPYGQSTQTPSYTNPYIPSPSHSNTPSSTDSSPNHSRRSSANASVSASPVSTTSTAPATSTPTSTSTSAAAPTLRGPHAPAASSSQAGPPKRSILKGNRSRESSAGDEHSSSSSPSTASNSPQLGSQARFGSANSNSPTFSPPGSGSQSPVFASSPQVRPTVRRAGSDDGPRLGEERGRSASRGSSSSLERSASSDRRASLSPASSYVTLSTAQGGGSGSRPIGIPGPRRGASGDSLNTLAGGLPGSRIMPDLPEASSESEANEDEDDSSAAASKTSSSVSPSTASTTVANMLPSPPIGSAQVQTIENVSPPKMDDAKPFIASSSKPNGRPPPVKVTGPETAVPAAPISPPLVPAPASVAPATVEKPQIVPSHPSTSTGTPRYRQPSPAKLASSATTEEEAHAVDVQSLSNSPALDPADLASTQWSDEPTAPSYARRSLLRAARGGSISERDDSTGRASVDSTRGVTPDDYGFGYYDDESETGIVGRTLDVAGTARDIIGALSRGLWSVASGRR